MSAEGKPIGELLTPRREKAIPAQHPDLPYIGLEHVEAHTTKLLGSVPATEMKSTANRFCTGDVLYSRLRPYLNKVWHADRDGLCSSEFIVLPGNDSVDANFLRYRLNSTDFVSFANSLNAGDRPRVDFDQISSFCILPFSLPEQRRIVAEIEKQFTRLEAGVAALRRVQANLKRYRAAVLKAACDGKIIKGDTSKWKTEKLGKLVTIKYGKMLATKELSESGYPVFGANGIIGHYTRFLYDEEQVLISCRGAYSGKINLSPPQCFVTNNSLILELPEQPQVMKRFLFHALQAVDKSKMVTGSAQPQVTINNAEVAEVPVPPLAEQSRIVAEVERRLSVVEELESVVSANLQRATRLRQSILQKAFTGKLQ